MTRFRSLALAACLLAGAGCSYVYFPQVFGPGTEEVDPKDYPYMSALANHDGKFGPKYCSATSIGSRWLITAGHCADDADIAVFGKRNLNMGVGKKINILARCRHPDFRLLNAKLPNVWIYDAALLKLAEAGPDPVAFATSSQRAQIGERVQILGWGGGPPVLRSNRELVVISKRECQNALDYGREAVNDYAFCTAEKRGADSNDSGGPILRNSSNPEDSLLIGIVSSEAGTNVPGIHADVASYRAWIDKVLSTNDPFNDSQLCK